MSTIAVLAGGASHRMGRDKRWILFKGEPLLFSILKLIQGFSTRYLVVEPGFTFPSDPPLSLKEGLFILYDAYPGKGPMGAILTALHAASGKGAVIIPVDMPLLPVSFLRSLWIQGAPDQVLYPNHPRLYPIPGFYGSALLPSLMASLERGELSLKVWLSTLPNALPLGLPFLSQFGDPEVYLKNLNTPEDLCP